MPDDPLQDSAVTAVQVADVADNRFHVPIIHLVRGRTQPVYKQKTANAVRIFWYCPHEKEPNRCGGSTFEGNPATRETERCRRKGTTDPAIRSIAGVGELTKRETRKSPRLPRTCSHSAGNNDNGPERASRTLLRWPRTLQSPKPAS